MTIMDNTSGRRWARWFLTFALIASVVGNVVHTILADSTISLLLRIPGAVIWPFFTFGGIEIVIRMAWEASFTHRLGRIMVLLPAVPAAIISYQHLNSLLVLMGENWFIALIGPAVIDGMMIGCTMVLHFTRPGRAPEAIDIDEVLTRYGIEEDLDWDVAAQIELTQQAAADAPVSPAPVSAPPAAPRAPRVTTWDASRVAELVVDGEQTQAVVDATGAGRATVDRFRRVTKILKADPRASIDSRAEKLRPEYVAMIRKLVSR